MSTLDTELDDILDNAGTFEGNDELDEDVLLGLDENPEQSFNTTQDLDLDEQLDYDEDEEEEKRDKFESERKPASEKPVTSSTQNQDKKPTTETQEQKPANTSVKGDKDAQSKVVQSKPIAQTPTKPTTTKCYVNPKFQGRLPFNVAGPRPGPPRPLQMNTFPPPIPLNVVPPVRIQPFVPSVAVGPPFRPSMPPLLVAPGQTLVNQYVPPVPTSGPVAQVLQDQDGTIRFRAMIPAVAPQPKVIIARAGHNEQPHQQRGHGGQKNNWADSVENFLKRTLAKKRRSRSPSVSTYSSRSRSSSYSSRSSYSSSSRSSSRSRSDSRSISKSRSSSSRHSKSRSKSLSRSKSRSKSPKRTKSKSKSPKRLKSPKRTRRYSPKRKYKKSNDGRRDTRNDKDVKSWDTRRNETGKSREDYGKRRENYGKGREDHKKGREDRSRDDRRPNRGQDRSRPKFERRRRDSKTDELKNTIECAEAIGLDQAYVKKLEEQKRLREEMAKKKYRRDEGRTIKVDEDRVKKEARDREAARNQTKVRNDYKEDAFKSRDAKGRENNLRSRDATSKSKNETYKARDDTKKSREDRKRTEDGRIKSKEEKEDTRVKIEMKQEPKRKGSADQKLKPYLAVVIHNVSDLTDAYKNMKSVANAVGPTKKVWQTSDDSVSVIFESHENAKTFMLQYHMKNFNGVKLDIGLEKVFLNLSSIP
ncbi:unnamed protein product [Bursaphelenchus okinawaensis]|uniref:Uncharacterized protein n=1 Tax=Bursaphelenchus okinawaensis TaxID=465554 RepID=A0A811LFV9_9BILA|nr:unnamed protein product [Bursaphelenchus okinawaensis]CAG9121684.1 unnamed protein product [Bursaphelenchus okinawaensis]